MLTPLALDAVFSAQECAALRALADEASLAEAGLVRGVRKPDLRRAQIAWLDEAGAAAWVQKRLIDTVAAANRTHFSFDLQEFAEQAQIARYDAADAGHFDWHVDVGDGPLAAKRKLTFVAQLSDPDAYSGGDLELNADGRARAVSRSCGAATLFPSFTPHRVTPVTAGRRYSLTTWVHGPAFR